MTQYEIEDRCNEYIGYPPEADEGLNVYMRREAFIAGCNQVNEKLEELIRLVKRMRKAQVEERLTRGWVMESSEGMTRHLRLLERREELESEVDEYLKKMEE